MEAKPAQLLGTQVAGYGPPIGVSTMEAKPEQLLGTRVAGRAICYWPPIVCRGKAQPALLQAPATGGAEVQPTGAADEPSAFASADALRTASAAKHSVIA